MSSNPKERLFFLDILKALCIVIVVSYHSIFVPSSSYESSFSAIETLFSPLRFCVPVLLTISFFLSERSLSKQTTQQLFKKRCGRLLVPILFWFSVAGALKLLNNNSLAKVGIMMLQGEIFHGAYYLLVLLQLTILLAWLYPWLQNPKNVRIMVIAQGLVFIAITRMLDYAPSSWIVTLLRNLDRPLIIYWFGYIPLGMILYRNLPAFIQYSRQVGRYWKLIFSIAIVILIGLEYAELQKLTRSSVPPFEYVLITSFVAVPILFLSVVGIKEEQVSRPIKKIIYSLSHYSLGIFCINGILSQIFLTLGSKWFSDTIFNFPEILTLKLVGWVVLLLLSLGLSVLLSRLGLKSMVS
jgi:Acyltransferase family